MSNYFEGWYYKFQNNGKTIAVIPGRSNTEAFIQIITDKQSYNIPFPLEQYCRKNPVRIGNNIFTRRCMELNINTEELQITGKITFNHITPLHSDIMGPFRFFPMECRHTVVNMNHILSGQIKVNNKVWDFTGGKGYMEGDSGRSFPKSYTWVHSNDFDKNLSIMASAAQIPFMGLQFWGLICVVWYRGKEIRLATYKGGRIKRRTRNQLDIEQGRYRLHIKIPEQKGHLLFAPSNGNMKRTIHENPACTARFQFYVDNNIVFDKYSHHTSYEFVK